MLELGTALIVSLLSLTGIPLSLSHTDIMLHPASVDSCEARTADTCFDADVCDVFVSPAGTESCALACDLRDLNSCAADGACEVRDGVCDYPASSPVGC